MSYRIGIDARKWADFGIGTYIQSLLEALGDLDQDNQYFVFASPENREHIEQLPDNFRFVAESAKGYSIREQFSLPWRILRKRLDLFHATHYVLPYLVPCKTVVSIHDIIHVLYPEFLPNRFAFFYAQRMIRHSLNRGDAIIASSQNTKTDLLETFGVDGDKIRVVYLGVPQRFRTKRTREEIEAALTRLGIKEPYLLFVGNPKPHKNLNNVMSAFARARELQDLDCDLVFVGDSGDQTAKIRRRASRLGIADRLLLLGRIAKDDLPAVYQAARLFVYPTLYEGFGFPVVEAMASGVPVVTSNKSALREIAEGYAALVNPLDVEELARAIAQGISDREHREALSKLGERRARDFRWRETAKKTLATYQRVLGEDLYEPWR